MDEEKKDNLEEKVEEITQNKTEEKKDEKVEEVATETSEEKTEEYVTEQLDDEEFENEKARAKADKKAAKKAKKEGKKKKNKLAIIISIIFAVIVVAALITYFVMSLSNPTNIVNDFAIYFNNEEWKSLDETIDWQGFLTIALMEENANSEVEENEKAEENEEIEGTEENEEIDHNHDIKVDYSEYDSKYEKVYDEIEEKGFNEIVKLIKDGQEKSDEILGSMLKSMLNMETIKIDEIISTEKVENTKSLYKVKLKVTITNAETTQSDTIDVYVAKKDGKYKLVGGPLPGIVYQTYIFYQYSTMFSQDDTMDNQDNTTENNDSTIDNNDSTTDVQDTTAEN